MPVLLGAVKESKKTKAIGDFFIKANNFLKKYKIGGNQRLQKIVGSDIYFKRENEWYWNIKKIVNLSFNKLSSLTNKL